MTFSDPPRLPGLTVADTRWLVAEAQRVVTGLGHSATVIDGAALRLMTGQELGLDNLARTLSRQPRQRWPRAVREQLTTLLALDSTAPVEPADLLAKLWPQAKADHLLDYEPLEPLPGVVAVLAAQAHRATREFGSLDLVGDRGAAYDAALTNLAALPLPRHLRRRVDARSRTSWVEMLESEDSFGAARVLVLPHLMRRVLRCEIPAHGVLVAVPTKFDLWVHLPVDEDVMTTALTMAWHSYQAWGEAPYPISPDVFLVSPDMQATLLIRPDHRGPEIEQHTMATLLMAMDQLDRGREAS